MAKLVTEACENCKHYIKMNARAGECLGNPIKIKNTLTGNVRIQNLVVHRYHTCDNHTPKALIKN